MNNRVFCFFLSVFSFGDKLQFKRYARITFHTRIERPSCVPYAFLPLCRQLIGFRCAQGGLIFGNT